MIYNLATVLFLLGTPESNSSVNGWLVETDLKLIEEDRSAERSPVFGCRFALMSLVAALSVRTVSAFRVSLRGELSYFQLLQMK